MIESPSQKYFLKIIFEMGSNFSNFFNFGLQIVLLGLIVGSFINALVYRLPRGISIKKGRSRCPLCGQTLGFKDLVPLLSYIFLRGRCRYCRLKIPARYFLVELSLPVLWFLGFNRFGFTLEYFYFTVISSFLVCLFFIDLEEYVLPDSLTLPAVFIASLWSVLSGKSFFYLFFGVLAGVLFFAVQYYLSDKKWVGDGDIRFGALLGAMFGFPDVLLAIWLAYLMGGAAGLIMIALRKKTIDSRIPFGPFLALSAIITIFFRNYWTIW